MYAGTACPTLALCLDAVKMVEESSGMRCVSLHHDVSTVTGEEVLLFTLTQVPDTRIAKNK